MDNYNTNILYLCQHCNLQCKYCYEKGKKYVKMSADTAFKAIDIIVDETTNKEGPINIVLFGGEPLLNWDVLLQTVKYIYDKYFVKGYKIRPTIISNGTLMNKARVRELFPYAKMLDIQISIDGDRETHDANRMFKSGIGSHDIVVKNCKTLLMYFPFATAKMVINDVDKFYDNVQYLMKIGFRKFDFLAVSGGHTNEYAEKFKDTVDSIIKEFSKLSHTTIGQISYPTTKERAEKKTAEANATDSRYKYFLPNGERIIQKIYTDKKFEHFEKGADASVNLLKEECKHGDNARQQDNGDGMDCLKDKS